MSMNLSAAMKLVNESKTSEFEVKRVNVLSDQLCSQFKIFLKAKFAQKRVCLEIEDETYNGFIEKCYNGPTNDNSLLIVDSYSLGIHRTFRSDDFLEKMTETRLQTIQSYLNAIESFAKRSEKSFCVLPINLKDSLFDFVSIDRFDYNDHAWLSFVQNLTEIEKKYPKMTLLRDHHLEVNQLKFMSTGEYLISDLIAKVLDPVFSFLYDILTGRPVEDSLEKKLLITDLDNTFWGGIVGDDGAENLQFQETSQGKKHWIYQKYLSALHKSGVTMAVCSKNSPEVVDEAFSSLDLVFNPKNFASVKANWDRKSKNILEICEEINILPSSVVFVDDNPLELQEVQASIPEISTLHFPEKIKDVETLIRELKSFFSRRSEMTSQKQREESYRSAELIKKAQKDPGDYHKFLNDIQMELVIEKMTDLQNERCFELINKTNQFNLHGERYSRDDFSDFSEVWAISLKDNLANHGIIGVVAQREDHLEQFVMSCRVFSRCIEHEVLQFLSKKVRFIPYKKTLKNKPTSHFLSNVIKDFHESEERKTFPFELSSTLSGAFPGQVVVRE